MRMHLLRVKTTFAILKWMQLRLNREEGCDASMHIDHLHKTEK